MSDYNEDSFDDSFESGTESEGCVLDHEDQCDGEPLSSKSDSQLTVPAFMMVIPTTHSDNDELQSGSASPKPKKKFSHNFKKPKKPNISFQKLKNNFKKKAPVFGVTLDTAIMRSQVATDGIELPTVFRECIDYLEEHGSDHEGLYRLPGVKSTIEDAKSRYDRGEVVDLEGYDVNTVASLLKQYLRELPDPLIPSRLNARLDSIATASSMDQYEALEDLMEDVPASSKLLLGWLLTHMGHIIDKSSVNKMTLPNMVIVFSPTLQISAPSLHALYNNRLELFGAIELRRYSRPVIEKKDRVKLESHLSHVASLQTEEEVSAELTRLTGLLDDIHSKMSYKHSEKDDYMWELQRAITILRRKKKALKIKSAAHANKKPMMPPVKAQQPANGENEFMKTLMLMEATLVAENEELISRRDKLSSAITQEKDLIDSYKRRLRNRQSHVIEVAPDDDDSEEETSMAKQVAALKWHNKELELRNKNLIESIQEEEKAIMDLNVKLKILPIRQQLNIEETVS